MEGAKNAWSVFAADLLQRGYVDRVATRPCVDDDIEYPEYHNQHVSLDQVFTERLGGDRLWGRTAASWKATEFFGMVEVLHDVVARPRQRWYHSFDNCGWHYGTFAVYPAQILYRWTVNQIMRRHGIELELAKSGEDVGRLVHVPTDDRSQLLSRLANPAETGDRSGNAVTHATALFRSRTATTEDKRSACIALAGVLESRRKLLKTELLSGDEGALFQIANQFAIRHQKADQRANYDEAYLDWIFWWYLATIELTNRLLNRVGAS